MKREDFELHVAYLYYRTGGAMPPLQAYRRAREDARHGPPKIDLRHLRGFKEYMAKVDAAAAEDTTDVPKALVTGIARKAGKPIVEAILSRLSNPTRVVLAIVCEVLLLVDLQDLLPTKWDDMLEWVIGTGMITALALRSQKIETKGERIEREKP